MFDEPPANLPVEPQAPTAGPAPEPPLGNSLSERPAASVPKPPAVPPRPPASAGPMPAPPMGAGMSMPKKQEPEDIFGNLDKNAPADSTVMPPASSTGSGSGRGLKIALIIVGAVAVIGVLGIGGYVFYHRFVATP